MYEPKKIYIAPSLLAVAIVIAFITWFRNMLSMNLFNQEQKNSSRRLALLLYFMAGACFFASSIAVMEQNSFIQFMSSFVGSVIGWKAFIVVFEGVYKVPTKQQLAALLQILVLSGLWEVRTFLINSHFV